MEREAVRVQRMAIEHEGRAMFLGQGARELVQEVALVGPVELVAHQRVPDLRQMDAGLAGAAGSSLTAERLSGTIGRSIAPAWAAGTP